MTRYVFPRGHAILVCCAKVKLQFDENDPNDRRRSQFIMKQQLDELEKVAPFCSFSRSLLS